MKKYLYLCLLALVGIFSSCGDENESSNNGGNGEGNISGIPTLENNQAFYKGEIIPVKCSLDKNEYQYMANIETADKSKHFYMTMDLGNITVGKNIDLVIPQNINTEDKLYFLIEYNPPKNISLQFSENNGKITYLSEIDGQIYENESCFQNGFFYSNENNGGLTFELQGILKNGDLVAIKCFVPKKEIYLY